MIKTICDLCNEEIHPGQVPGTRVVEKISIQMKEVKEWHYHIECWEEERAYVDNLKQMAATEKRM